MKLQINQLIKITSATIVTGTLCLECWNFYLQTQEQSLNKNLNSLLTLGSIILAAHLIEAVIASIKAYSSDRNPIRYGIYTFFVGFVGLQELSND